jgi:MinD superfamily P-loop ATPase
MKQVVIISGKGGTGKTVLTASFAALAPEAVIADCDVDAANLHLLLDSKVLETHPFSGGRKARLDAGLCTRCGACDDVCRFGALERDEGGEVLLDPLSCEGCAVCSHICPAGALVMEPAESGEWYLSRSGNRPFIHARLGIGEESSGKLVTEVRSRAAAAAEAEGRDLVLIDGPPGIGCPVIASLSGTDLALIVSEPTLSGRHDLERVIGTTRVFQIPTACCVNKADINPANAAGIEDWCREHGIPVLGRVPFENRIPRALAEGVPPVSLEGSAAAGEIRRIWDELQALLAEDGKSD